MIRKNFVIRSLIAPCYSKPSFSSAKITEAVFGETVEVLEVKDSWIHIRQEDDYKSWLKSFYGTFEEHPFDCDYIVIDKYPLLFGNRILKKNQSYKTINGHNYNFSKKPIRIGAVNDFEQVLSYAKSLIGCPYRWGGKTSGGFDCSGFVQTLFLLTGMLLPRDSWQQSEKFNHAIIDGKISKPGDLHFFGSDGKISHVGISTGGYNLIHCQGWVKEESFEDIDSANKKLADMYMHTCSVELNSAQ